MVGIIETVDQVEEGDVVFNFEEECEGVVLRTEKINGKPVAIVNTGGKTERRWAISRLVSCGAV